MDKELNLLQKAKNHVLKLYTDKISDTHFYHSFNHTVETVDECKKMAKHYKLDDADLEILLIAAWFHDCGYAIDYKEHERESAQMAREFLEKENVPNERIEEVSRIILSTHRDSVPSDLLEQILHDADLGHIGKKNFFTRGESLRLEWELILNKTLSDIDWEQMQLQFLLTTPFYTEYALAKRQDQRIKNIEEQRLKVVKAQKEVLKTSSPGRGTETMYRAIYRNHINLSSIADSKANMMISINTIIMSVIITVVGSGFSFTGQSFFQHLRFALPIVLLLVTTTTSVIFAILSASPNVTNKRINKEDIRKRKSSLLFFGNFSEIPMEQFLEGMSELRNDKDTLYDNMTIDLYHLGSVLTRKYRLLKISYLTFLGGLLLCVASFFVIFLRSYSSPVTP